MPKKPSGTGSTANLRSRAEAKVLKTRAQEPSAPPSLTQEEAQRTIHELQVHQVELKMQNDELLRVQNELELAGAHYFDLYHLAPIGYCILSREGLILEANLTAVNMLDQALSTLVKKPISKFILNEDRDIYYLHQKQLYATNKPTVCELRMVKQDGSPFWVQLRSAPPELAQAMGREPVCRVVMSDITERRTLQEENSELLAQLRKLKRNPKKP
jgi:PAS domain S-box-containing protein